jgi:hypothetical protein
MSSIFSRITLAERHLAQHAYGVREPVCRLECLPTGNSLTSGFASVSRKMIVVNGNYGGNRGLHRRRELSFAERLLRGVVLLTVIPIGSKFADVVCIIKQFMAHF